MSFSMHNNDNSVSSVLTYCKLKVLAPYFRLTSFLGWRPLLPYFSRNIFINLLINLVNYVYTLLILFLIFLTYFLSYCTCYRGDGLPHLLPLITSKVNSPNIPTNLDNSTDASLINLLSINGDKNDSFTNGSDYGSILTSILSPTTILTSTTSDELSIELVQSDSSTCNNKLISHFLIPDLLHFASYIYLLYLLRTPECERLENLMERGFLQLSQTANWFIESRRLISTLRGFLLVSSFWILANCIIHIVHFNITLVNFNCLPDSFGANLIASSNSSINCSNLQTFQADPDDQESFLTVDYIPYHLIVNNLHKVLIYLTVICLTVFDIICSAVVTSYAVHCQLNISFITSLCQGVREKRITFQEFYQRAEESRKFVAYLNTNQAVCVSLISIVFICKICLYSFLLFTRIDSLSSYSLLIISAILWTIILLIPLIQAVRLTQSCQLLRSLGHELKARPFGYQHADEAELNSLLQYTSSLDMVAKLFNLPIKSSSIVLIFSLIIIGVPLLGQMNIIAL